MKSQRSFSKMKAEGKKISMVTAYDASQASLLAESNVDCALVGDSLAMVIHGFPSTVHATVEMMAIHIAAVSRTAPDLFVVGDMPFLSYRKGVKEALESVDVLMKAGANAVKLEGIRGHEDVVKAIVQSGVPVMGHLGLTPQSIHQVGGFKVQGRDLESAKNILEEARVLEELGCFSLVLECVPSSLAREITNSLAIPTIGIGAGKDVDGQVLVFHDLVGLSPDFSPKFLKHFCKGRDVFLTALNTYDTEVKGGDYPSEKESY
jgi:3-methyl-2-oxobutanoate hydroxymethyltransferase